MAIQPVHRSAAPAERVDHAVRTHVGRRRATNEDRWLAEDGVYAVADGVGGGPAGEVAATLAVAELRGAHPAPNAVALAELLREINHTLRELGDRNPATEGMATTLTAVVAGEGRVAVAHVGDSSAYRLRDGRLERLTRDHSVGGELVRSGLLDPEAASVHPLCSMLTRSLGTLDDVEVDRAAYVSRPGDVYLLCTDGLTGAVPDDRIAQVLRTHRDLDRAATRLVECALRAGGRDNVTVVLFRA